MRVATVVGARPQFIKSVLVSRELRKKRREILVHTGQHYEQAMSGVFFEELGIAQPDHFLHVGPGNPAWQVGTMIVKLEEVLRIEKPDMVLVYGDTHSTLAGAVAAAKMNIPLAHVEAGLRSFRPSMPEEKNRVVTDHLSQILFCPTKTAVSNLKKERIQEGVHLVGDVMADALDFFSPLAEKKSDILNILNKAPNSYCLATVHRAENADFPEQLKNIFKGLSGLGYPVILPLHPRTQKTLRSERISPGANTLLIEPVGYLDMLVLEKNARLILTDSGGVQKEAFWLGVPCVTLRQETEWVETVKSGWNFLAGTRPEKIKRGVKTLLAKNRFQNRPPLGNGKRAAESIAKILDRIGRR